MSAPPAAAEASKTSSIAAAQQQHKPKEQSIDSSPSATMTANAFITDLDAAPPQWRAYVEKNGTQFHEKELSRMTVIGGGAFGTALATVAARKGARARVWARDTALCKAVNETHINEKYLPGQKLPEDVFFTTSVEEACENSQCVILALPTPYLRAFLEENLRVFPLVPILVAAKGIEIGSLESPFEIAQNELPGRYSKWLGALAGPSFAKEMVANLPTNVTISSDNPDVAFSAAALLSSRRANFRVYPHADVIGAECAGAVKNVLAIAAGAADKLGLGNNARVGMVCRGLAELKRLSCALGSSGSCISGLAGTGDLFLTCSSPLSRNFRVGVRLASGEKIDVTTPQQNAGSGVAEGILTAKSIHDLSAKLGVHMPICEAVFQVLYEGQPVLDAISGLSGRPLSLE